MKAGRELDVLVAEKVMGCKDIWQPFQPSTEISDAWIVRQWLLDNVGGVRLEHLCDYHLPELCQVYKNNKSMIIGRAETAPLAICLAALKAVEVDVE